MWGVQWETRSGGRTTQRGTRSAGHGLPQQVSAPMLWPVCQLSLPPWPTAPQGGVRLPLGATRMLQPEPWEDVLGSGPQEEGMVPRGAGFFLYLQLLPVPAAKVSEDRLPQEAQVGGGGAAGCEGQRR